MTVRVDVAPSVLSWALDVTGADEEGLHRRFKLDKWLAAEARPTLKQLQDFAKAAGVPFGYLLLPQPPAWSLPVPDFREGFEGVPTPSANLIAVIGQSQRRQEWYRDYALGLGAEPLAFVGSAAQMQPIDAAAQIRDALDFQVSDRHGTWTDTRRALLRGYEALGGLTVATSMVENNTRPESQDELSELGIPSGARPARPSPAEQDRSLRREAADSSNLFRQWFGLGTNRSVDMRMRKGITIGVRLLTTTHRRHWPSKSAHDHSRRCYA